MKMIKKPALRFFAKFKAYVMMKIMVSIIYLIAFRTYLFINYQKKSPGNEQKSADILSDNLNLFYFTIVWFVSFTLGDIYFWYNLKKWVDQDD